MVVPNYLSGSEALCDVSEHPCFYSVRLLASRQTPKLEDQSWSTVHDCLNKENNRILKEVDHFKYLGRVLTRDGYCRREIKMRIVIAKEAFNRKMSLLTCNLNIELKKKLVRCYIWSIALYGSDTRTLRKLERKYL